jgi:multimeric flavodoxin WrbA
MAIKVFGLSTSPRRGGNTELLLDEVLRGAEEKGAEVEKVNLSDLEVAPCAEYEVCYKTGECVIRDDFDMLLEKFIETDRLVFAAPIFFMGLPAQAKAVVDRIQSLWARKHILKKPLYAEPREVPRKALFVSVGGTHTRGLFDCALRSLHYFLEPLEMELAGSVTFPGIDEKGAILKHPTAMQEAYQQGAALAE